MGILLLVGRKSQRLTCSLFLFLVLSVLCLIYYQNHMEKVTQLSVPSRIPSPAAVVGKERKDAGMRCHLPDLDPFDVSVQEFIHPPEQIDCEKKIPRLFRTNFLSKLIPMKIMANQSCCYRTMGRTIGSDTFVRLSKTCHPLIPGTSTEIPPAHEFISITCNFTEYQKPKDSNSTRMTQVRRRVTDMFAFVPPKRAVEKRIKDFTKFNNQDPNPANGQAAKEDAANDRRLSVLMLGIDAQSRMNFLRQMPLTYNFLTQNLSGVEFKGYTKVGDNTFPNVVPILTGLNVTGLRSLCWQESKTYFDKCPFIWNLFREHGYITSYGEDSVWMGIFTYEKRGFWKPPTDYYLNPFINQMSKKIGHEPLGNVKLCYGPRQSFEVLLDYIVKTSVRFRDSPYFQFIWANSLFHDYLNTPKLGDEMLASTLNFLHGRGLLNRTVVVLLSDHGMRWGGIRNTVQGRLEERMPMNFWIFPPWFHASYPAEMTQLKRNSLKLTTPFDVHETLKSLLDLGAVRTSKAGRPRQESKKRKIRPSPGISFFEEIPTNRTCESAGIEEHWCVCNGLSKIIDKNLTLVQTGAKFIVSTLNHLLRNHSECAKLTLNKIINVSQKGGDEGRVLDLSQTILQVILRTVPGEAIFEATIKFSGIPRGHDHFRLVGEVSRINLYASQSSCVSDFVLKKYCYCTKIN